MKKIKLIAILILIFAIVTTFNGCTDSSPEAVAEKYFNALITGDIETLEECKMPVSKSSSLAFKGISKGLTNSLFGTSLDDNGMNALAGTLLAGVFSGYKFEITGSEINGESAEVSFDIYINGELSMCNEYLPLTKYNGKWYVTLSSYLN